MSKINNRHNKPTYINTMFQFLSDIGIKGKLLDCICAQIDVDELIYAIKHNDIKTLMELKGVGKAYASRIIEEGTKLLDRQRKRIVCKHWHYMAAAYTVEQMLDPVERDMLDQLAAFTEQDDVKDVKHVLDEMLDYERKLRKMPYYAKGAPEFNSLPSSIMADILDIKPNTVTNKIVLYKHNNSSMIKTPLYNKKTASVGDYKDINDDIEGIKNAFLVRGERNGFITESGDHYRLFTHSSSQLKKESGYFILAEETKKHRDLFWFGMSPDEIASRTDKVNKDGEVEGTVVMTKIFQWRSLLLSASLPSTDVLIRPIDMRKVIVVPELKKTMTAEVMSVSSDYKVTEGVRSDIENPLWDGQVIMNGRLFGLICAQLRALGLKGLGVGVDVPAVCKKRGYAPVITDVNGVTHNLETEEWHLIADASTLKMLKPYGTTYHYFDTLERLGLTEAYVCAVDGEEKEENTISRQMLSSLFDVTSEELKEIACSSITHLNDMQNLDVATDFMAESDRTFDHKSNMGKVVSVVPEIMKVEAIQDQLKDRYLRLRDQSQAGKLRVNGKYFFAALDPVAWIDVHIGHKNPSDPSIGVLRKGEVSCAGHPVNRELCCLRNPHAAHEWYTAWNMRTYVDVAQGCIVFNVHDLAFRIMQMDFDGDHILVIQNDNLAKSVNRMQKKYHILPIYYGACAPKTIAPIPRNQDMFADQAVECVTVCQQFNKVGQYSNFICSAWSLMNEDMSYEDARAHLRTIAIIAAGVNGAVDAQKKFDMVYLPADITNDFDKRPYNQRHHAATLENPSSDNEYWDAQTMPLGNGSVDRTCVLVDKMTNEALSLDTSSLEFDWTILLDMNPDFNKQPRAAIIPSHIIELISSIGKVNGFYEQRTYESILNGEAVGLKSFFNMIKQQNENFIDAYIRMNSTDGHLKDGEVNKLRSDRTQLVRKIFAEYIAATHMPHVETMSEDDRVRYAANILLKDTFRFESNAWRIVHLIRWFGDIYADVADNNRLERFAAKSEAEQNTLLGLGASDEEPFSLEGLTPPPAEYALDTFVMNPMDDVCNK